MKSISDLLNLLAASPSDGNALLKGSPSVSGKGPQSNGNSFGDLLTQLANQQDNAPTNQGNGGGTSGPGSTVGIQTAPFALIDPSGAQPTSNNSISVTDSLVAISQTDISITESIQISDPSQLVQAEQSLATLAAGLSKLLNLFSSLQGMDIQQAQNAIVSLAGGQITPSDAMGLLNAIQEMTQKDAAQNPLLMTPDQQSGFLNQAFQQMLQAQQLVLGTFNKDLASFNSGASDSTQIGNVVLQMSFSDTSISAIQRTGAQTSQVYVDLETFQMSATFIQAGTGLTGSQQGKGSAPNISFQPLPQAISDPLLQSFNQALLDLAAQTSVQSANDQGGAGSSASPQYGGSSSTDPTTQTFKNLVQLLVQSGASQAVLTSYMNQAAPQVNSAPSQSQVQNTALDNFLNNLNLLAQNPSLGQTSGFLAAPAPAASNKIDSSPLSMVGANFLTENITQTSILMETQSILGQAKTNADQASLYQASTDIQISAVSFSAFEANIQGAVAPPMDLASLNDLNDAVARFNLAALQMGQDSINAVQPKPATINVEQLLADLQAFQSSATQISSPQQTSSSAPLVIENLNVLSGSLAVSTNGSNPEDAYISFQAAGQSTSLSLNGAGDVNSTTIPQQGGLSGTVSSNGPVQISVNEAISSNGVNIQVQLTANGSTINTTVNDPRTMPQTTVPSGVSMSQNISASLLAGEGIKNSLQPQVNSGDPSSIRSNVQSLELGGTVISEVKPITPDAVLAAGSASQSGSDLNLNINSKDAQTSAAIEIASSLLATGSAVTPDKNHMDISSSINLSNGSINSAQILNQISQQIASQAADSRTVSRLNFQLVPESLGRVTVQIALVDQSVSARIIVTNLDVKEVIQHHMVDLKAALNQSGLQIDQLQVQVQGGGSNLLAQYYQFQQEGFGYQRPEGEDPSLASGSNSPENTQDMTNMSAQLSMVNMLA